VVLVVQVLDEVLVRVEDIEKVCWHTNDPKANAWHRDEANEQLVLPLPASYVQVVEEPALASTINARERSKYDMCDVRMEEPEGNHRDADHFVFHSLDCKGASHDLSDGKKDAKPEDNKERRENREKERSMKAMEGLAVMVVDTVWTHQQAVESNVLGQELKHRSLAIQNGLDERRPIVSYFRDGREYDAVVYHQLDLAYERLALSAPGIGHAPVQIGYSKNQQRKPSQLKQSRYDGAVPRSTAVAGKPGLLVMPTSASATHQACVALCTFSSGSVQISSKTSLLVEAFQYLVIERAAPEVSWSRGKQIFSVANCISVTRLAALRSIWRMEQVEAVSTFLASSRCSLFFTSSTGSGEDCLNRWLLNEALWNAISVKTRYLEFKYLE
jgi:hypothetical protein